MPIQTVLNDARVPVKIWTADIEAEAKAQVLHTAALPFVFKHVAVMPDVHAGKGATVGSVVATRGAIVPACVGVDIGCGMMAVKLALNRPEKEVVLGHLPELRHSIERSVPLGRNGNSRLTETVEKWEGWQNWAYLTVAGSDSLRKKATDQMGSLGGGNHFIELCLDTEENLWLMLHSGSRGIGNILASKHIDVAKGLMKSYFIEQADPDLAYLAEGTAEFGRYIDDLTWAQGYAAQNRVEMMGRVLKDVSYIAGMAGAPVMVTESVNCHHNYVAREHHFGENVMVTRKGAVRARAGDLGIIPGSMGAKSFIVRGLGNADSFHSCSHGAGRRMSRTKARANFTVQDLETQTSGVECRKDDGVLDEIPGAYKDIDRVMADQSDLVEIVATLKQVLCVKG